jgi:hypothetical protein
MNKLRHRHHRSEQSNSHAASDLLNEFITFRQCVSSILHGLSNFLTLKHIPCFQYRAHQSTWVSRPHTLSGLAVTMAVGVSSLGYEIVLGLPQRLEGESGAFHGATATATFVTGPGIQIFGTEALVPGGGWL